jgi:polysaccharide biosynthesis transport protein
MRRPSENDPSGTPLAPYSQPVYTVNGNPAQYAGALPPPAPAARTLPTLLGLLNALKRRWVLGSFLGILAGLAAAAGVWIAMPTGKHQVQALLGFQSSSNALNRNEFDLNFENYKQSQMTLIKTRTLLNRVAKKPTVTEMPFIKGNDEPGKWIQDQIKLKWEAPDILNVSMNGDNPEQLRIVLDELVHEFVDNSSNVVQKDWLKRKRHLEDTKADLKAKIEGHKYFMEQISKQYGVTTGQDAASAIIARMSEQGGRYDSEINDLRKKMRAQDELFKVSELALTKVDSTDVPEDKVDQILLKNPEIRDRRNALEQAVRSYDREKARVTNEALLAGSKAKIDEMRADLKTLSDGERAAAIKEVRAAEKAELRLKMGKAREEVIAISATLELVEKMRAEVDAKITDTAKAGTKAVAEYDDMKPLQEHFARVSGELLSLEMEMKGGGRVVIHEDAIVMMNFNIRNKMLFSAAVAVAAFGAVLLLVAYLEWRSRRVDSVDQIVNELGMRIIGTIPAFPSRASLKAGEADQNQNWRFILNESVNSTRTMLLHTAKTQQMQVIMVTSAMQGEGKTSLASQLATSMATAGLRTLILDCDLRNPSMHRLFDVALTPGCSEILCSEVDVADAVQPTTVPNLWMIPAGQCSNRVIAALAQGHPLETLFNRLRGQFDFIVVDSCPVLPVADALLVGQHVDGAVISVLQDISQLPKVLNAQERLTSLNIPLLGAVVNGIKTDIHAYGYNYVKQLPA